MCLPAGSAEDFLACGAIVGDCFTQDVSHFCSKSGIRADTQIRICMPEIRTFRNRNVEAGVEAADAILDLKWGAPTALITLPLRTLDIPTAYVFTSRSNAVLGDDLQIFLMP